MNLPPGYLKALVIWFAVWATVFSGTVIAVLLVFGLDFEVIALVCGGESLVWGVAFVVWHYHRYAEPVEEAHRRITVTSTVVVVACWAIGALFYGICAAWLPPGVWKGFATAIFEVLTDEAFAASAVAAVVSRWAWKWHVSREESRALS